MEVLLHGYMSEVLCNIVNVYCGRDIFFCHSRPSFLGIFILVLKKEIENFLMSILIQGNLT